MIVDIPYQILNVSVADIFIFFFFFGEWLFFQIFWNIEQKQVDFFFKLNFFRKFRITISKIYLWLVFFKFFWRNVVKALETHDFGDYTKNKNFVLPVISLMLLIPRSLMLLREL